VIPVSEAPTGEDALRRQRPFVLYWLARVSTALAHQMITVGVGWQMYALTGSALDLELVGLAQFVPSVLLLLVAGHVADRRDRRRVLQACAAAEALAALTLCAGSALGMLTPRAIFALVFLIGAARAFQIPTMQALLPSLVPSPLLARAIAANSTASQAATVAGPALGGLVYIAGAAVVYGACAVLFVAAGALIQRVHPRRAQSARPTGGWASMLDGIRFVRRRPIVLGAISLDLFAVLLGGATALLPIYARDILHTGPWGLGLLRSATAVGALGMALWLAHHPLGARAGRKMLGAVAVFGAATIVFGLSRSFALSLAVLVVLGAADVVSVVVRQTLVQLQTPDHMRGRVSAVNAMFFGTSNQLGEFESGVVAAWIGVVPSVVVGGLGTLAVVLLWIRLFPGLAKFDRLESAAVVAEVPPPAAPRRQ